MKHFLLVTAMCFLAFSNAQELKKEDEKLLDLSTGYGYYHQYHLKSNTGSVIGFTVDYKVNKTYKVSQMTQFGFITERIDNIQVNYVNQHLSILGTRSLFENRHFQIQAGAGLGYTNYHHVQVRKAVPDDGSIAGTVVTKLAVMQMSFPIVGEVNYLASKSLAIGFKFGGYIPTHAGIMNYTFIYPQVKFSL